MAGCLGSKNSPPGSPELLDGKLFLDFRIIFFGGKLKALNFSGAMFVLFVLGKV